MSDDKTKEDLFNEAAQADEAGSNDEKEEETTEESVEENASDDEEEGKDEGDEGNEDNSAEDLSDDEDLDDPALILQRYKSLQGMYRSQKEKLDEIQNKVKEQPEQKEESKKEEEKEEPAPSDEEDIDTSWVSNALDSNEKIKEFAEDFPEIKEVLEVSLKSVMQKYTQAMGQAFQSILQQIDQKYQPIAQSVGEISKKERDAEIKSAHPDYDKLVGSQELNDWIDSQPSRLKETYTSILQDGSKEEIVELLNDFKLKTGIKMPQEKKKPKATPQVKAKAPSSKPPVDMDDFEQAFQEAIREGD
jgi:hypothetical protein